MIMHPIVKGYPALKHAKHKTVIFKRCNLGNAQANHSASQHYTGNFETGHFSPSQMENQAALWAWVSPLQKLHELGVLERMIANRN